MTTTSHMSRVKKAELLSSLGAGVLGAGIALLWASQLASFAMPILLIGLISHAVGMSQKHGLDQQNKVVRVWWVEALYWFCWLALAALLLWIFVRQF